MTNGTMADNNFQISGQGLSLLKSIEQLRLKPYDDQSGKQITSWCKGATIGYGHLIVRDDWEKYSQGLDEAAANALFITDLSPFVKAVSSKVTASLSQNQFDALVIFVYNIGIDGFSSSSVLKLVNDPTARIGHKDLESAWKAWNKSQGVVNAGLANRRNAEWRIFSENIYQGW
jgi:type VI secretion system secreted protein VgrG